MASPMVIIRKHSLCRGPTAALESPLLGGEVGLSPPKLDEMLHCWSRVDCAVGAPQNPPCHSHQDLSPSPSCCYSVGTPMVVVLLPEPWPSVCQHKAVCSHPGVWCLSTVFAMAGWSGERWKFSFPWHGSWEKIPGGALYCFHRGWQERINPKHIPKCPCTATGPWNAL